MRTGRVVQLHIDVTDVGESSDQRRSFENMSNVDEKDFVDQQVWRPISLHDDKN